MTRDQQDALMAIAIHAAFIDGAKDEREREQIRQLMDRLGGTTDRADLPRLYQDVLLGRVSLASATAVLTDTGQRQLAYEVALCVCEADGSLVEREQDFLEGLRQLLDLPVNASGHVESSVDDPVPQIEFAAPQVIAAATAPAAPAVATVVPEQEEQVILNHALLAGALELLPQSWASMAIIPLQIKMVYGIGKAHGVSLDQGHIKEFIAAAGVGLTSQYLEQFGRKLLGGLLGKAGGKMLGGVGKAATGMAFSFATTYALGQVAARYYAGGRTMSTAMLRDTFQNLLGPAKQMQTEYLPQIRQKAATLDAGQVMTLIRS